MVSGILNYELWITNDNFKNNKICLTCVKPETLKHDLKVYSKKCKLNLEINSILFSFRIVFLNVNQLLNKNLEIFVGFQCLNWQEKIFRQGFCYDCFIPVQWATGLWNQLSTAHLGIQDQDCIRRKELQCNAYCLFSFVKRSQSGRE
jgi:hypothetical protein